jgi:hypothetical protein
MNRHLTNKLIISYHPLILSTNPPESPLKGFQEEPMKNNNIVRNNILWQRESILAICIPKSIVLILEAVRKIA